MHILTLLSNFIYLFVGLYLLYEKRYGYGLIGILVWLVSHIYHNDKSNSAWNWKMNMDIIISSISFIMILINCRPVLFCMKNFIFLSTLFIFYGIGYYYYYHDMEKYYFYHSIWHILSGLFLLFLILNYYKYLDEKEQQQQENIQNPENI